MLRAGELSRRGIVQEPSESQDGRGEVTVAWSTYAKRWMSVVPLSGRELFEAQQVDARVSHRIKMRYDSAINSRMRIAIGSRIFNIASVINVDESNEELRLMCTESV